MHHAWYATLFWIQASLLHAVISLPTGDLRGHDMTPYMKFICSPHEYTPQSVLDLDLKTSTQAVHDTYRTKDTCWMVFEIEHTAEMPRELILEHQQALTSYVELIHQDGKSEISGYDYNFSLQNIRSPRPTFRITLHKGLNRIIVKQRSRDQMWLHFYAWTLPDFKLNLLKRSFIDGGFVVLALGLALYNILQLFAYPHRSIVFYVGYLVSVAWAQLFISGYLKILAPEQHLISHNSGLFSVQLAFLMACMFMSSFLNLKSKLLWGSRVMTGLSFMACFGMFINLTNHYTITGAYNLGLLVIGCPILFTINLILAAKQDRQAILFLISWVCVLIGVFIQVLVISGLISNSNLTGSASLIGHVLQIILSSLALADRIRQSQKTIEKEKEHAFTELQKMIYPHQLESIKQGKILEQTMPCRTDEAIVLCFDIVNSSQLDLSWSKEFISQVLSSCQKLMLRGGASSDVRAHRIKELGDGFLCSVGFPFVCDDEPADTAYLLALEFIEVFENCARSFPHTRNLLCSVGIATGSIEGFFTLSGTRSYDMFGQAIVLATRYEGIRKKFNLQKRRHLITVQDRVYSLLSQDLKKQLNCYQLHRDTIRDDHHAKEFYYTNIEAKNHNLQPLLKALAS